jgi:uncharacterized protein
MEIHSKDKLFSPKFSTFIKLLSLFFVIILTSNCSNNQPDFIKLRLENDSLVQRLVRKDVELDKYKQSNVRIKNSVITELISKFTNDTYDIYISYPNNYEHSGKQYPVLVVLDAEVNFGAIDYISKRLIKDELIPELFIVGIAYKGETDEGIYYSSRSRDFTPTSDSTQEQHHQEHFKLGSGGAENFVKFLSLELLPYLKDKYPIKNEEKSLYGHSFGGLLGFHILLNHPTLFDNYLLLSPSLWWNQTNILKDVKLSASIASKQLKLYVATGALEGNMVDDQINMVNILKRSNPDNVRIKSEILDNETHRSIFGRGFTNGLRFLQKK